MKRLAAASVTTAVVYGGLSLYPSGPSDPLTQPVFVEIAIVASLAAIVMVIARRVWSWRAVGLCFFMAGVAVLYWAAAWRAHTGRMFTPEWALDLGRSFLIVGGTLLATGLVVWCWANWRIPGSMDLEEGAPWDGEERRRIRRRKADREKSSPLAELIEEGEATS